MNYVKGLGTRENNSCRLQCFCLCSVRACSWIGGELRTRKTCFGLKRILFLKSAVIIQPKSAHKQRGWIGATACFKTKTSTILASFHVKRNVKDQAAQGASFVRDPERYNIQQRYINVPQKAVTGCFPGCKVAHCVCQFTELPWRIESISPKNNILSNHAHYSLHISSCHAWAAALVLGEIETDLKVLAVVEIEVREKKKTAATSQKQFWPRISCSPWSEKCLAPEVGSTAISQQLLPTLSLTKTHTHTHSRVTRIHPALFV